MMWPMTISHEIRSWSLIMNTFIRTEATLKTVKNKITIKEKKEKKFKKWNNESTEIISLLAWLDSQTANKYITVKQILEKHSVWDYTLYKSQGLKA